MNPNTPAAESGEKFTSSAANAFEEMSLIEYWRAVCKRKWAILALALVLAMLAAAVVFALPNVYRATATVLIEASKTKAISIEDVYANGGANKENYQTQVDILKSREVALRTINALKLWEVPEFDPRLAADNWKYKLKAAVGLGADLPEWDEASLPDAVLGAFQARLSVQPVRLSQLVKLQFESTDPKLAARVVNLHAQMYIQSDRDSRFQMTQQVNVWLQEQLAGLRENLSSSEKALQAYREKQGLVSQGGVSQSLDSQQIASLTQRLVDARVRRAEMESVVQQLKSTKDRDYSSVSAVLRNQQVADAKQRETAASLKVSELSQRYASEHSRMQQAQAELKAARENLLVQTEAVANSLIREYEQAKTMEKTMESTLMATRGAVVNLNRKEFELGVLEREVQSNKQLYDMFINRAKETSSAADLQSSVARVVDRAIEEKAPIKPKRAMTVLIAFVLGALLGVGAALLLETLDNTLKTTEDVESRLNLNMLAALPELSKDDRKHVISLFSEKPESLYSESIRTARTGVMLSNLDVSNRIVLVTSSVPGEGKTTLCTNLAFAHAQTGRTLLIDADMRRPQVGHHLGLPAGAKGLSNLVAGTVVAQECVHRLEGSSLMVLPAGELPPNPQELLSSQRFKSVLEALSKQFDVILIDSPPVELVSDALLLAPLAHSTIYVVKANDTPYQVARKGLSRLHRAGGHLLGVVLNRMDFNRAQKYYGEYSGYAQYGSYGYSSNAKKAKA